MSLLSSDIEKQKNTNGELDGVAIIGLDNEGRICYLNDGASKFSAEFKFEQNEKFHTYFTDAVLENGLRPHPEYLEFTPVAAGDHFAQNIRLGMLTPKGNRFWVDLTSYDNKGTYLDNVKVVIKLFNINQRTNNGIPAGDYSLASMLNNIEEGFVIIGRDHRVLYYNEKAGALSRALRNIEPVRGRLFKDYAPEEFQLDLDTILKDALAGTRSEVAGNFYLQGKRVVLNMEFTPYVVNSIIQGVVATFKDFTFRKELEEQLQVTKYRFDEMQQATGDVVFEFDLVTSRLWVNSAVESLLGYSTNELENLMALYERIVFPEDILFLHMSFTDFLNSNVATLRLPEVRFFKRNGSLVVTELRALVVRNSAGTAVRIAGSVRNITDRITIDKQLKEELAKLDAIQRITADVVYDFDLATDQLTYNEGLFDLLGYSSDEIGTGRSFMDKIMHPDDISSIVDFDKKIATSTELFFTYPEFRMIHKNGSILNVEVKFFVFRNKAGRVMRMVGNVKNITKQHKTENLLRNLNQRYELAIKASYDIIWERNFEHNEYYFSEALTRNLGYDSSRPWPVEEFQNTVFHKDDRESLQKFINRQYELQVEQFTCPVHRYIKSDGSIAFVDVRCFCVYNKEGKPVKTVGISRDITQQYLAEEALRKSNERFELASRASYDLIWDVDGSTQMLTCSENIFSLFGHSFPGPVHFREFLTKVLHPEDVGRFTEGMISFVRSEDTIREFPVHRAIKGDGSIAYTLVRVLAIRNTDNSLIRLIGVTKDITNRYLSDEEIRSSNKRYEMIADLTKDVIMEVDLVSDKVYVNKSFSEFYGFDINDYNTVEEAYRAIIHKEDQDRILGEIMRYRMGKETRVEYKNFRLVKKDGTVIWVDATAVFTRDKNGKALRSLAIVRNVNEAYLSEVRLRKSNERYELAAKASFDMLWEIDFASNKYLVSDEVLYRMFGYASSGVWSPQTIRQILVHPDDQDAIYYFEQNCYRKREEIFHYPIHRHIRKDGSVAYVQVHCIATYNELGQPVRTVGVTRDITQRYLLEKQLRKANERNELVAKAASDLVWEWNYRTDELMFWNDGVKVLFGYDLPDNKATMQWRVDRIHPDDRKQVNDEILQHFNAGASKMNLQYRFLDEHGQYHHVLDRAYITYDVKGAPERITGAVQDITQMKNLEAKMADEQLLHQQHLNEVTIITQEKEREEIGRELHDNINQLLAITMLYISMADTDDVKMRTDMVARSTEVVKKGIEEIRKLSKRLISPVLDMGLDEALKALVDESGKAMGVKFKFHKDKYEYSSISHPLQMMVYRIAQEQFNNISKYANAANVKVDLSVKKGNIFHLIIFDDGDGFDTSKSYAGVGLRNMRSRVKIYDGKVELESSPGKGCKVEVIIPLDKNVDTKLDE